jgi:hypothetical protein
MIKTLTASVVASLAVTLAACTLFVGGTPEANLGGAIESTLKQLNGGLAVGIDGTALANVKAGTCNLIGNPTIATNTPAFMDCAATGVVSGDIVLSPGAAAQPVGWSIVGAHASSTSGYITFAVANLTGASGLPPVTATSSVAYVAIRR